MNVEIHSIQRIQKSRNKNKRIRQGKQNNKRKQETSTQSYNNDVKCKRTKSFKDRLELG